MIPVNEIVKISFHGSSRPSAPARGASRRYAGAVLALFVFLSACVGPPLQEEDDESVMAAAIAHFNGQLLDPSEISSIHRDLFLYGYTGTQQAEFGRDGSMSFAHSLDPYNYATYCVPGSVIMETEADAYLLRSPDRSLCVEEMETFQINQSSLGSVLTVESSSQGKHFTLEGYNEEGDFTGIMDLDAQGRLKHLSIRQVSVELTLDVDYSAKKEILPPKPTARMAAWIHGQEEPIQGEDGAIRGLSWMYQGGDDFVPLSELEVRVVTGHDETREGYTEHHATFTLDSVDRQYVGGFKFQFMSNGDNNLNAGDAFTIENLSWSGPPFRAVLWDLWADERVGYNPICHPNC